MKLKERLYAFGKKVYSISEKPILTSTIVLLVLGIIVILASLPYYKENFHAFYGQVLAEAHGMIFDIAVIGILIFWLNKTGEKRSRIRTYKDEIDDFRLWESEEAAFRTVGNIKRLNRHKLYNINLAHSYLVKTNLNYVKLPGANLNYANIFNSVLIDVNLEGARLNQTNFENCNMNQSLLRKAYANGAIFKDTYLIKADFEKAFLIKADFRNAFLMEANLQGAYLTGADFTNANLYKTDFRGAKGLTIEALAEAKTLYLAKFDEEIRQVIKNDHPELAGK
ncbi:MAG: pentapeptide repeat-containing protein [Cyclobacteriaceae bacterium]|nr:pentapeptide repeat-containing protein [Cyclobacteriaceae bacterium]MCK5702092.1 pentapeptide repeat-containing protein [Cyclobacteriaceae bacterium]